MPRSASRRVDHADQRVVVPINRRGPRREPFRSSVTEQEKEVAMFSKSRAFPTWVALPLLLLLVLFGSLVARAGCQLGCATFAVDEVTNQINKNLKVQHYQFV